MQKKSRSYANLGKGAVTLSGTSIPIGGKNTNSVIAGHRGYASHGMAMFREIERLKIGDLIFITNPWEKMAYKVTEIDIISPYAVDELLIQEGKDMISLLSCHPYAEKNPAKKMRYLVRAERTTDFKDQKARKADNTPITASDGTIYTSSTKEIEEEKLLQKIGIGLLLLVLVFGIIMKATEK